MASQATSNNDTSSPSSPTSPSRPINLIVKGVPQTTTPLAFRETFLNMPGFHSAELMCDAKSGMTKGFGFVMFVNEETADAATAYFAKTTVALGGNSRTQLRIERSNQDGVRELAESPTIFVRNIPRTTPSEGVDKVFAQFGTIRHLVILRDQSNDRLRKATITFSSVEEARAAKHAVHGQMFFQFLESSPIPLMAKFADSDIVKSRRKSKARESKQMMHSDQQQAMGHSTSSYPAADGLSPTTSEAPSAFPISATGSYHAQPIPPHQQRQQYTTANFHQQPTEPQLYAMPKQTVMGGASGASPTQFHPPPFPPSALHVQQERRRSSVSSLPQQQMAQVPPPYHTGGASVSASSVMPSALSCGGVVLPSCGAPLLAPTNRVERGPYAQQPTADQLHRQAFASAMNFYAQQNGLPMPPPLPADSAYYGPQSSSQGRNVTDVCCDDLEETETSQQQSSYPLVVKPPMAQHQHQAGGPSSSANEGDAHDSECINTEGITAPIRAVANSLSARLISVFRYDPYSRAGRVAVDADGGSGSGSGSNGSASPKLQQEAGARVV